MKTIEPRTSVGQVRRAFLSLLAMAAVGHAAAQEAVAQARIDWSADDSARIAFLR